MANVTCPKCNTENKLPTKKCKECGFIFKFQEIAEVEEIEKVETVVPIKVEEKPKKEFKEIIIEETEEDKKTKKRLITATLMVCLCHFAFILFPNTFVHWICDALELSPFSSYTPMYNVLNYIFFGYAIAIGILSVCKNKIPRRIALIMTIVSIVATVASMTITLFTELTTGFGYYVLLMTLIVWTSIQIMSSKEKKEA